MFIIIDSLLIPFLIRQSSVCTYVSPKEITREAGWCCAKWPSWMGTGSNKYVRETSPQSSSINNKIIELLLLRGRKP